jgi:GNAT superfamily N-acetyltransferase
VVRRSIVELCYEDHRGDPATLKVWLANKTPKHLEEWLSSEKNFAVVAERDEVILGFALLHLPDKVELLYVSPEARFSGISKALLKALESAAYAAGVHEVRLDSSATALRFYNRLGYLPSGPPAKAFGLANGYPMSRSVAGGSSNVSPGA